MDAWVLWHRYSDGSGAHVERVYLQEDRANEDFALLRNVPGASVEWKLDKVSVFGRRP